MKKPPCPPKSDCWCIEHPNNPECNPPYLSIDKGVVPMVIIGLTFGILVIKRILFKSYNYGNK